MKHGIETRSEHSGSSTGHPVDAALTAWRHKAIDVMLAVVSIAHVPVIAITYFNYGPAMAPFVRRTALLSYAVIVAAALLRRVDYRVRLWAFCAAAYAVLAVANVALPQGPFAQVGVVTAPVMVLVFSSRRAGWVAGLLSLAILVCAPLAGRVPAVAAALSMDIPAGGIPRLVWVQVLVRVAFLIALFAVLGRFHQFVLEALAAQLRATSDLEQEMGKRQQLERELAGACDRERRSLGHELHDGVCQQMTAAMLHCQVLGRRVEHGGTLRAADFQSLSGLLAEAIGDARNVAKGLCPLEPDPDALTPALRALAKRTQEVAAVRCEFAASGDVRVPDPEMAQHLYRIAQEALSNAVRHAHANRIQIDLDGSVDDLWLRVRDDGTGLPPTLPPGGMGLRTMAYRAQILGGKLVVAPGQDGGLSVSCYVLRKTSGERPLNRESGGQRWVPTV